MACQKSAPTLLRHHSFAKSLVQEKEKDLEMKRREDAYNYHILQSGCLIKDTHMYWI